MLVPSSKAKGMAATGQPLDPSPIHGTFQIIAVSASALTELRLRIQMLHASTGPVSRARDQIKDDIPF
ncbi:MAG TPA: hypothetical protein VE398_02070 [Acidobacteriota bacterium]|nr:hypothetical protein [Acidobacteriota bacterium]